MYNKLILMAPEVTSLIQELNWMQFKTPDDQQILHECYSVFVELDSTLGPLFKAGVLLLNYESIFLYQKILFLNDFSTN